MSQLDPGPGLPRSGSGPAPRFGKEHRESARRPGVAGVFVLVLVPATTGTAARPTAQHRTAVRTTHTPDPAPRGTCASPANPMVLHRTWCASSRPLSTRGSRARYTEVRHRLRNYSAARVTAGRAPSTPPRPRPRPLAPSPRPPLSKVVNASQAQMPCMHVLTMAPAPLSPQAQTQSTCMPLIISRYARWARSLST